MTAPQPLELLARHGAFLRRLARAITSSDADADDLVQDTWVTALERPPRHAEGPRGWLALAARRLNGRRHRAQSRRAAREVVAARPEAVEVSADAALVLQEVVRAVVALEEPLRATVTARYFEDLPVREIARRHGASVPTVKGRLRRARAELREVLDDFADGDRRAWCSALVGLGLTRPAAPIAPTLGPQAAASSTSLSSPAFTTGALFMLLNAKVVAGVSLALAVAAGLTWGGASLSPEPLAPEETGASVETSRAGMEIGARADEERRTAGAEPEIEQSELRAALPVATFTVLVTDLDGVPASGVDVLAGPLAHPLDYVGTTGSDGVFSLSWSARGAGEIVIGLRARGELLGGLRRFRVAPGGERRLVAAVDAALLPSERLLGAAGLLIRQNAQFTLSASNPLRGVRLRHDVPAGEDARRSRPGALEPATSAGDEPLAFISDGEAARSRAVSGQLGLRVSNDLVTFMVSDSREVIDDARVRGTVRDLLGEPARGVRIAARRPDGKIAAATRSDSDGAFELDMPTGVFELIAGAPPEAGGGGAHESVELAAGDEHRFDPRVERGLVLRGEAHDLAGQPFAGGRIEATHTLPGGLWVGIGVTGEKGRFELPNCPGPVVSVDFAHPQSCHGLPLARHDAVATGGESWPVQIDTAAFAETQLVPLDEDVHGPLAGELRVWDARGERGTRVPLRGPAGSPVTTNLPEGGWSLAIGAHGPHWSDSIPLLVSRGDPIDLGPIAFEPGGWLELASPAEGVVVRVVRTDGPNETVVLESLTPFEGEPLLVPLPVGEYRIERATEGSEPVVSEVQVRAAQTTRV